MGLRITFLTILLGLLWSTGPYFYKGHKGCVECHIPHLETDGTCADCHRGDSRTHRTNIAHYRLIPGEYACFTLPDNSVVKNGYLLIKKSECRRCHRTGQKGNTLATDLDSSLNGTLPEALADAIKNPGIFMPNFYFPEAAITRLVNAILASSAVYALDSSEPARIIHFEENREDNGNIFNNRCGSCHRILTIRFGGLGQGNIGPNLSGLFSKFYYQNFKDGNSWDSIGLEQWLKNPRKIRSNTQMPPVHLDHDEFVNLVNMFIP